MRSSETKVAKLGSWINSSDPEMELLGTSSSAFLGIASVYTHRAGLVGDVGRIQFSARYLCHAMA